MSALGPSQALVHGTALALGRRGAALLRGPSGAGKSDLALRCMALPPQVLGLSGAPAALTLLSDDQVLIERCNQSLILSHPRELKGLLEVRGLGILRVPVCNEVPLRVVIDLKPSSQIPRMPAEGTTTELLGLPVPLLTLAAFEASAAMKVLLALMVHSSTGVTIVV